MAPIGSLSIGYLFYWFYWFGHPIGPLKKMCISAWREMKTWRRVGTIVVDFLLYKVSENKRCQAAKVPGTQGLVD